MSQEDQLIARSVCAHPYKLFEVNPMVCPRCQIEMEVVALITEPAVIDKILRHRNKHGLTSP